MKRHINDTQEHEETKKLAYVIVFLSLFVVVLFGLVPFA
jgi:hypothetical protein